MYLSLLQHDETSMGDPSQVRFSITNSSDAPLGILSVASDAEGFIFYGPLDNPDLTNSIAAFSTVEVIAFTAAAAPFSGHAITVNTSLGSKSIPIP